jgi:hypothetical protein
MEATSKVAGAPSGELATQEEIVGGAGGGWRRRSLGGQLQGCGYGRTGKKYGFARAGLHSVSV